MNPGVLGSLIALLLKPGLHFTKKLPIAWFEAFVLFIGGSSSGRTTDSDSVNLGSNPSPPASYYSNEIMKIYIDESGQFIQSDMNKPSISCVGALVIPHNKAEAIQKKI